MTAANRRQTFSHALAFVIGFSMVFIVLGASVAFFGYALNIFLPTFVKIVGALLILFGLQVLGVWGWIADRVRAHVQQQRAALEVLRRDGKVPRRGAGLTAPPT